jgi:hypothetical protein
MEKRRFYRFAALAVTVAGAGALAAFGDRTDTGRTPQESTEE